MGSSSKRVSLPRSEARLYIQKALQFVIESGAAHGADRYDAAMLNAVHAAISAADAVTAALAGIRSADPDHQRAVDLLEEVLGSSSGSKAHLRQLRMLLGKKNAVEYESRRATSKESADALRRATRLVDWARTTVDNARL